MRRGRFASAVAAALAVIVVTGCGTAQRAAPAPIEDTSAAERSRDAEQLAAVAAALNPLVTEAAVASVAEPAVEVKATLPAADMPNMGHVFQTMNNCGPAAVVMALSTFGVNASQEAARLALRGEDIRRGMGPQGVDGWVKEQFGLRSMWRNNGTNALLKKLVSNGFAPMVTQWMIDPEASRISHWRTVRGYDDARGVFYVNDSMLGRGVALSYDWFGRNWQPFSYRYMVIYRPEDEPKLRTLVGDDWIDAKMRRSFYERTKAEALAWNTSAAWLAYGEASYQYGEFREAVAAFERGMALGSPTGVFTMRSSYPNALRALGRQAEAEAAAGRLVNLTPGVVAAAAPPIDERILALVAEREREAWYAALPEEQRPTR
jgi:uncharacterized protein